MARSCWRLSGSSETYKTSGAPRVVSQRIAVCLRWRVRRPSGMLLLVFLFILPLLQALPGLQQNRTALRGIGCDLFSLDRNRLQVYVHVGVAICEPSVRKRGFNQC